MGLLKILTHSYIGRATSNIRALFGLPRKSEAISGRLTFRYKSNLILREIEGLVMAGVEIVGEWMRWFLARRESPRLLYLEG